MTKTEKTMVDLSALSLEELERAVADEKRRRRAKAISELEAVAERHGFSLGDFGALPSETRGRKHGSSRQQIYGTVRPRIRQMLLDGMHANDIAREIGWTRRGAIYGEAKLAGIKIVKGRAVL